MCIAVLLLMTTSSLIKQFSRRKMDSLIWKYFEEQANIRRSKCPVTDLKGRISGNLVEGKNAANLKSHSAAASSFRQQQYSQKYNTFLSPFSHS